MVDEKALRRPDIDVENSVPIQLFDTQEWLFPKPRMDLGPASVNGHVDLVGIYTFGFIFEAKLEAVGVAIRAGDTLELARALFGLAIDLLRRNYDLADADLFQLLRYRPGDDANAEMWRSIIGVAKGSYPEVPKASPATSASPS